VSFKPIELGNIDAKRDWSHAKDFVEGIWTMLNQNGPKEYLLSSNETHSVREFIELAFKEAGIDADWDFVNGNQAINEELLYPVGDGIATLVKINPEYYRPAEVESLIGDCSKAKEILKWKPEYTFEQLVQEMCENDLKLSKEKNYDSIY
jgi:GDPmannose 4,6-dehydratase